MKNYLKNNKINYLGGGVTSGVVGNDMLGNIMSFLGKSEGGLDIASLLGKSGGLGGMTGGISSIASPLIGVAGDKIFGGPRKQITGNDFGNQVGDMAVNVGASVADKIIPGSGLAVKALDQVARVAEDVECTIDPRTNKEVCFDKNKMNLGGQDLRQVGKNMASSVGQIGKMFSGEQGVGESLKNIGSGSLNVLSFGLLGKDIANEQQKKAFEEAQLAQNRKDTYAGMKTQNELGLLRKQQGLIADSQMGFGQTFLAKKGGSTKKWIQKATEGFKEKGTEGALTKQAKSAGKSISEFCKAPPSPLAKKRCQFRKNVSK
jgi:hypothetical protein